MLADELAQAAWLDGYDRLARLSAAPAPSDLGRGEAVMKEEELPASVLRAWTGALALEIHCCGAQLRIIASGDAIDRWLRTRHAEPPKAETHPAQSASVPVARALDATPVRLSVELAPVDVDLGSLGSLRVGDVLRTTHGLDRPLQVRLGGKSARSGSGRVCEAFLGKQGDVRVAELLSFVPLAS